MRAYVLSDEQDLGAQAQQILVRAGYECSAEHRAALTVGADQIPIGDLALVVVVLPPEPARGLSVVAALRGRNAARIIAIGPAYDPQMILDAVRHGANDFVDECAVEEELAKALKRL